MELDRFIELFAEQFEDTPPEAFNADTAYHDLDEYSSILALSIMAMVGEEYDVALRGEDLRNAVTIRDLFNIVQCSNRID